MEPGLHGCERDIERVRGFLHGATLRNPNRNNGSRFRVKPFDCAQHAAVLLLPNADLFGIQSHVDDIERSDILPGFQSGSNDTSGRERRLRMVISAALMAILVSQVENCDLP